MERNWVKITGMLILAGAFAVASAYMVSKITEETQK